MPTIGTCSLCGGAVQVPDVWGGLVPPQPVCSQCGARAANAYGPVIPMEKRYHDQQPRTYEQLLHVGSPKIGAKWPY